MEPFFLTTHSRASARLCSVVKDARCRLFLEQVFFMYLSWVCLWRVRGGAVDLREVCGETLVA